MCLIRKNKLANDTCIIFIIRLVFFKCIKKIFIFFKGGGFLVEIIFLNTLSFTRTCLVVQYAYLPENMMLLQNYASERTIFPNHLVLGSSIKTNGRSTLTNISESRARIFQNISSLVNWQLFCFHGQLYHYILWRICAYWLLPAVESPMTFHVRLRHGLLPPFPLVPIQADVACYSWRRCRFYVTAARELLKEEYIGAVWGRHPEHLKDVTE